MNTNAASLTPQSSGPSEVETAEEKAARRAYYVTEHFVVIRSVYDKWGGRRIALIERRIGEPVPYRIDPRLKSIKQIIMVWKSGINVEVGRNKLYRAHIEANEAIDRFEKLWPLHIFAKEYRKFEVSYAKFLQHRGLSTGRTERKNKQRAKEGMQTAGHAPREPQRGTGDCQEIVKAP